MHKETTYRLTGVIGDDAIAQKQRKVVRIAVDEKLTSEDLERLKDPERNHKLLDLLRDWILRGKPIDDLPVWKYSRPDGSTRFEPIRAISLVANDGPAIVPKRLRKIEQDREIAFATYDRIEMVRIDVYDNSDAAAKARYSYVPVYVHQIVQPTPPNRAFALRCPYEEWPTVKDDDKFLCSIYKFSLVQVERAGVPPLLGYFRGLDSNDGRLKFTPQYSRDEKLGIRFSPTTVTALKKFTVDRLGCRYPITREVRTWRGKACM
jgi:CRISPR-associated endonuclease Csn1